MKRCLLRYFDNGQIDGFSLTSIIYDDIFKTVTSGFKNYIQNDKKADWRIS